MLDYRVNYEELNAFCNDTQWADRWQDHFGYRPETDDAVKQLLSLAQDGPLLGICVGTGRHVIPLVERGAQVSVIDPYPAMLAKLKAKNGADQVDIHIGQPQSTALEARFSVVFILALEIQTILDHSDQQAFFTHAADHLVQGGVLVVECMNPKAYKLSGRRTEVMRIRPGEVTLSCEIYRPEEEIFMQALVFLKDQQLPDVYTAALRWNEPEDLISMAGDAGLSLEETWSDWKRTPADENTPMVIYIFRKR